VAAFGNQVEYQLRLADWFAFRFSGNAIVFSGVTGASVVAVGATFRYNFSAGLTAGLPLGHAVRLAFVADVGYQPAFDLTIGAAILRAIETQNFNSGGALVVGKTTQFQPGASFAWAPHPAVGLSAEIRYVHTEVDQSSDQNATADAVNMAALVDFDLGAITRVPIALTALYRLQQPVSSSRNGFRVENAGGGIFYSGRVHLATGLALTYQWFDVRPHLPTTATLGQIMIRYYW
jgi:hypothetical protein